MTTVAQRVEDKKNLVKTRVKFLFSMWSGNILIISRPRKVKYV